MGREEATREAGGLATVGSDVGLDHGGVEAIAVAVEEDADMALAEAGEHGDDAHVVAGVLEERGEVNGRVVMSRDVGDDGVRGDDLEGDACGWGAC